METQRTISCPRHGNVQHVLRKNSRYATSNSTDGTNGFWRESLRSHLQVEYRDKEIENDIVCETTGFSFHGGIHPDSGGLWVSLDRNPHDGSDYRSHKYCRDPGH